jgi:hypothetical protein
VKTLLMIATISAGHFLFMVGLFFYALGSSFETFDCPERAWLLADTAASAFEVLAQPGWGLLHRLPGPHSFALETALLFGSSLLWGCGLFCLIECLRVIHWVAGSDV